ncbi:MAG: hemin uptake protein HemP [Alphaproteobacteria bacterium]|nr:hemin uptake protein HemP [Alphaproteobacteria bacterium]HPF45825.1 hemin uptake protein HemP [Emcibacteraceae bacterium]HRW29129.1 hemin uptake protein HemP [Emcibacteraceae bacterium]
MIDDVNLPSKEPIQEQINATGRCDSSKLLQGRNEIIIVHGDVEYRLRKTSQNKLILTK